jgi:hypothetical protein
MGREGHKVTSLSNKYLDTVFIDVFEDRGYPVATLASVIRHSGLAD